jgi:integrase
MALTTKRIAKLTKKGRYRDAESRGLYLQVGPTGTKSWLLRYELNGVERFMGLGSLADFALKEARERARSARQKLADGIDPIDAREAEQRARQEQARKVAAIPTFKGAAERYFTVHGDRWRNAKHRAQFLSTLEAYAFPRLGRLRVDEITSHDVLAAIEPIWKKVPETASRVRGRIESVLSWAIANKYREGPNPARWSDNLEHLLPARASNGANHHAALPYAELPDFMAALAEREGTAARALEFTILTAARTGETIGATWDEIDFDAKTWTVPAERMKAGREHVVPLSERALETLAALPRERGNPHIFIAPTKSGAGLSNMAMSAVLKRMGRGDITVHGMRSAFRDWAGNETNFPRELAEEALAHTIKSQTERAYRRKAAVEKRRKLMQAWTRFVATERAAGGTNVVPIAAGRSRTK